MEEETWQKMLKTVIDKQGYTAYKLNQETEHLAHKLKKPFLRIPKDTIEHWLNDGFKPRKWQKIAIVSQVIALDEATTSKLLKLAGHLSVGELRRNKLLPPDDRELLAAWEPTCSQSTISDENLSPSRIWRYCHPASYFGPVWIQIQALAENQKVSHELTIQWGPWEYYRSLQFTKHLSVLLQHMKGNDGFSIPILLEISLPCRVWFGQGELQSEYTLDINRGWYFHFGI